MKKISLGSFPLIDVVGKDRRIFESYLIKVISDLITSNQISNTINADRVQYITPLSILKFIKEDQKNISGHVNQAPKSDDQKDTRGYKADTIKHAFKNTKNLYQSIAADPFYRSNMFYPIYIEEAIKSNTGYADYNYDFLILANDLLAQAKANPGNFAMLAITNSDDQGSKNNGGEYDNIAPGQMTPKFNDFVFNNPVGTMGVVETEFGFHVMKVSGKNDAVLLGTIAQKIQASDATIDAAYTKASQLEASALANSNFEAVAKKAGLVVTPATNIKAYDEFVQGLGSQREVVRWSFNKETELGAIKRFEVPQGFVVAKVKDVNDTKLLPLDVAKQSVEPILKNQKKAEIIKKKMEEMQEMNGGPGGGGNRMQFRMGR